MYSSKPNLIIGFHGCEKQDEERLITDISYFKKSEEDYDWLGHGMYFWEGNEKRAWQWAQLKKKVGTLIDPAVIGAVCDLGRCFDLLDSSNIETLKKFYELFVNDYQTANLEIPQNIDHHRDKGDKVLRYLDRAVIEYMHGFLKANNEPPFDSIRAAFIEGKPIYPTAGFHEKTHIQICIINPNCIKGVFLPRKLNKSYASV